MLPRETRRLTRSALHLTAALCAGAMACLLLCPAALAASGGLTRFLVQKTDAPGFLVTGQPLSTKSVHKFLTGDATANADAKRLRKFGFVGAAKEQLKGNGSNALGTSVVIETKSAKDARALAAALIKLARQFGPGTYTRIKVRGVPSAGGYTYSAGGVQAGPKKRYANVYWVQGRCVLFAGDFRPGTGPLAVPVRAAVKAVHRRTGGHCP